MSAALLGELLAEGAVAQAGAWLHLPQHRVQLASADRELWQVLELLLAAALAARDGAVRAAALRDDIGGGRKVAILILEFFDRIGYTRRVRDQHHLRGEAGRAAWFG